MKKIKIRDMVLCALFAALIAVGAFIKVPVPFVPFTLQTFFVSLAGLLLGARYGALSALVYMLLGLCGLPVFTEGGGIAYLLKPTFGYIIGFVVGAYVTGRIAHGGSSETPRVRRLAAAVFSGLGVIYLIGVVYFYLIRTFYLGTPIGVWPLLLYCFIVFIPGDSAMGIVSVILSRRLLPLMKKSVKTAVKERESVK